MIEFWQETQNLAPADITLLRMPEMFINNKYCFLKTLVQVFTAPAIIMSRFCMGLPLLLFTLYEA